jgi:hypothetical protein
VGQSQQGPKSIRKSITLSDNNGLTITATMFGRAVEDASKIKLGNTVSLINVETGIWNDKINLKSTDETRIQVMFTFFDFFLLSR